MTNRVTAALHNCILQFSPVKNHTCAALPIFFSLPTFPCLRGGERGRMLVCSTTGAAYLHSHNYARRSFYWGTPHNWSCVKRKKKRSKLGFSGPACFSVLFLADGMVGYCPGFVSEMSFSLWDLCSLVRDLYQECCNHSMCFPAGLLVFQSVAFGWFQLNLQRDWDLNRV